MLGQVHDDGTVTYTPRAHTALRTDLVIDLATLRREQDHPCLLDGHPVPAQVGRDLAGHATAWRRLVTAPVTGHLLDYGTTTYLPAPLRSYTLARDGHCRAPGCTTRTPSRLQMDHATPYPTGPSTAANCGTLCTTCHQLKTAGHTHITDSTADGSATWHTRWGQTITIPPRPVLPGRGDPDPPDVTPDAPPLEDPPPF